ncbi:YecA family protein [Luteimonas sp BLCC-B24]|uniref:YecA/YgfB family protein n=1 Tax=Luteimonas sp. BLCC-B24 TaxID=3025317 RepID=UPI00234D30F6|nr:YecA family protein [Luteimonas sp. BLCC-B24]MDC7806225.1 YecA family protein [Luteimonas sp. BLCC-B24]
MPAMSEPDLDALETLLETTAAPHGGMSLEMLDGYLSALVVGPTLVSPGQYMEAIWGDGPPPGDADEAQRRMALVVALWNHIAWRVAQPVPDEAPDDGDPNAHDPLMPLVQFPEVELQDPPASESLPEALVGFPAGAEWAQGFFAGVALADTAWDAWIEDDEALAEDVAMLSRLGLYSEDHARDVGVDADEVPAFEERLEMIGTIPEILAYCNDRRRSDSGRRGADVTLH